MGTDWTILLLLATQLLGIVQSAIHHAGKETANHTGLYQASTSYQSRCNYDGTCTYTFSITIPGTQLAKPPDAFNLGTGFTSPEFAAGDIQAQLKELTKAVNSLSKGTNLYSEMESLKREIKKAKKFARRMNRNSQELMTNVGKALNSGPITLQAGKGQGRNYTNNVVTFQSDSALKEKLRKMERKMKKLESMTKGEYQAARKEESVVVRVDEPRFQKVGMDCAALHKTGVNVSGIYKIQPDPERKDTAFYIHCDMETDGGGWSVIQQREDGTESFNRTWDEYKKGFGDLEFEYWLGLHKTFMLNQFGNKQIRFDIWDFKDKHYYAQYDKFKLSDEDDGYKIKTGGYSGTAGDAFHYANKFLQHHNMKFSTYDRDNDKSSRNCAKMYSGGWWYQNCMVANLNGIYYNIGRGHTRYASHVQDGIMWRALDSYKSFKKTQIKVRPPHFKNNNNVNG